MNHMVDGEIAMAAAPRPKASEECCVATWFSVAECKAERGGRICELFCATDDTGMSYSFIGWCLFLG